MRTERCDVRRYPSAFEVLEVLAERFPLDREVEVGVAQSDPLAEWFADGAERPAFAKDLERHALTNVALSGSVHQQGSRSPRQHVDESRSHRQSSHVELFGSDEADFTDGNDGVPVNRDVSDDAGASAAVVDRPASQNQIDIRCRGASRDQTCEEEGERAGHIRASVQEFGSHGMSGHRCRHLPISALAASTMATERSVREPKTILRLLTGSREPCWAHRLYRGDRFLFRASRRSLSRGWE